MDIHNCCSNPETGPGFDKLIFSSRNPFSSLVICFKQVPVNLPPAREQDNSKEGFFSLFPVSNKKYETSELEL